MDSLPLNPDDLRRLVTLFEEHRLLELEVRDAGLRVRLQAASPRPVRSAAAPAVTDPDEDAFLTELVEEREAPPSPSVGPQERGWVAVSSPMTGTWYRLPGPGEPPFVEVGAEVDEETVVGLIEAMKMFSQIRAEVAGIVMELPLANGTMVQPGDTVAWVLPSQPLPA